MGVRLALIVAIVLIAIGAMNGLAHVVKWPRERTVSALPIARAQRAVRRYGILLGIIEFAALLALLVVLFKVPVGSSEMWLAGAAALCVAAMLGLWAAWLRPLNMTIAAWTPHTPPADWQHHHRRWSTFHRLRIALAIIAIALLLMGVFAKPAQ
jgi:hypothetical protein